MFDVLDGFTLSTTLRLLQTNYRANALAQMEGLRLARAYKARYYVAPDTLVQPIPAFGQVETQIRMTAGTYIWGISFYRGTATDIRIQVVDAATEVALFSDYIKGIMLQQTSGLARRAPTILGEPKLISEPSQVNVEIYNDDAASATVQLVLYCAEPVQVDMGVEQSNRYIPLEKT